MARKKRQRTHFRGKPRPGRRVPLCYRADSNSKSVESVTRNIGTGGAFILSDDPLPVGTELSLAVRVPTSDEPISLTAEVRWQALPNQDGDDPGMGVEFVDVEVSALLELNKYFSSLTGTDLTGPHAHEPEEA